MTSRNPLCGLLATAYGHEELDSLEEPGCVQLLQKTAQLSEVAYESEDYAFAVAVVKHLGHHTLAILHAGSYIAAKQCSIADYLDFLRTNRRRLLEMSLGQGKSRYDTVYATFGASIEFLELSEEGPSEETRKDALQLLKVLSSFHYMSVPLDVLEDAWNGVRKALKTSKESEMCANKLTAWHVAQVPNLVRTEKEDLRFRITKAVTRLESLALVRTEQSVRAWKSVSMHPLVHGWVRDRQSQQERKEALRMTECIVALSHFAFNSWRPYYHQFATHLKLLVGTDVELVDDTARSRCILQECVQIALIYHWMGLNREMYEFLGLIFRRLGLHDQEPTQELRDLYHVFALAVDSEGSRPAQALRAFEAIARLDEKTLSENDSARLAVMRDLGRAYLNNAQSKKAIVLLRKVVEMSQELWDESEKLLVTQNDLGAALLDDGQIKEAITLLEKVVETRQRLPSEHPSRLASQQKLAVAYVKDGQIAEAARRLEEVARIQAQTLGEEHPDTASTQDWLAEAYRQAGRLSEAVSLCERAFNNLTLVCGEKHPNVLRSQNNLARAYLDTGMIQEATNILERVINIQHSTLDDTDHRKLSSQHLLGRAYLESDRVSEAIGILEKVVDVEQSIFEEKNIELLTSRHELARAYLGYGRISEAIGILERVVDIKKSIFKQEDHSILESQHVLAQAYLNAGRNSESVRVLEQLVGVQALMYYEGHHFRVASQNLLDEARAGCDRASSSLTKTSLSPAENTQSDSVVRTGASAFTHPARKRKRPE